MSLIPTKVTSITMPSTRTIVISMTTFSAGVTQSILRYFFVKSNTQYSTLKGIRYYSIYSCRVFTYYCKRLAMQLWTADVVVSTSEGITYVTPHYVRTINAIATMQC